MKKCRDTIFGNKAHRVPGIEGKKDRRYCRQPFGSRWHNLLTKNKLIIDTHNTFGYLSFYFGKGVELQI